MSITRKPNAYFVCIILHKCMLTIFMFLCAYSSWIRLGSVYFQIMSLEIARSSCFQRRWKKLHPWATLAGNGLLKFTNKCLACATREECKCEHERSLIKNVFVCENQLWINLNAGVWWYDNDLNRDAFAGMKAISLDVLFSLDSESWTEDPSGRWGPFPVLALTLFACVCSFQLQLLCKNTDVVLRECCYSWEHFLSQHFSSSISSQCFLYTVFCANRTLLVMSLLSAVTNCQVIDCGAFPQPDITGLLYFFIALLSKQMSLCLCWSVTKRKMLRQHLKAHRYSAAVSFGLLSSAAVWWV